MGVRKNAKWHLPDIPEDCYLLPEMPRRQRAQRERHCKLCGITITQGEEHLAVWRPTNKFYPIRLNYCAICALAGVKDKTKEVSILFKYLKTLDRKLLKYIDDNNLQVKKTVREEF